MNDIMPNGDTHQIPWRHDDNRRVISEDAKRQLLTAPEVAALFGVDPTARGGGHLGSVSRGGAALPDIMFAAFSAREGDRAPLGADGPPRDSPPCLAVDSRALGASVIAGQHPALAGRRRA